MPVIIAPSPKGYAPIIVDNEPLAVTRKQIDAKLVAYSSSSFQVFTSVSGTGSKDVNQVFVLIP